MRSLGLSSDDAGVWFHVMDEGPAFKAAPKLPSDIWSENGRGLFLIQALAHDFIMRPLPGYGTFNRFRTPQVRG